MKHARNVQRSYAVVLNTSTNFDVVRKTQRIGMLNGSNWSKFFPSFGQSIDKIAHNSTRLNRIFVLWSNEKSCGLMCHRALFKPFFKSYSLDQKNPKNQKVTFFKDRLRISFQGSQ